MCSSDLWVVERTFGWMTRWRQNIEPRLAFDASDDFDDEIKIVALSMKLAPVVGAVGEQMLDPRPALTNGGKDHLSPGAVRDIAGGQVN